MEAGGASLVWSLRRALRGRRWRGGDPWHVARRSGPYAFRRKRAPWRLRGNVAPGVPVEMWPVALPRKRGLWRFRRNVVCGASAETWSVAFPQKRGLWRFRGNVVSGVSAETWPRAFPRKGATGRSDGPPTKAGEARRPRAHRLRSSIAWNTGSWRIRRQETRASTECALMLLFIANRGSRYSTADSASPSSA